MSLIHRAVSALVSSALAVSLVGRATRPGRRVADSPAGHGATWLAGQLNAKGLIHNRQFVTSTTTASPSTRRSRSSDRRTQKDVARSRTALSKHVASYTTGVDFGSSHVFTGAVAKLARARPVDRRRRRSFGGTNLVRGWRAGQHGGTVERSDPGHPGRADRRHRERHRPGLRGRALLAAGSTRPAALSSCSTSSARGAASGWPSPATRPRPTRPAPPGARPTPTSPASQWSSWGPVARSRRAERRSRAATRWLNATRRPRRFGGRAPRGRQRNSTGLAGWALH